MQFCQSWRKDTYEIRTFTIQSPENMMKNFFLKKCFTLKFILTPRIPFWQFCWKNLSNKSNVSAQKLRMINKGVVFPEKKHSFKRSCGDVEGIFENKNQKNSTKFQNLWLKIMNWWKKIQNCNSKQNVPLDS